MVAHPSCNVYNHILERLRRPPAEPRVRLGPVAEVDAYIGDARFGLGHDGHFTGGGAATERRKLCERGGAASPATNVENIATEGVELGELNVDQVHGIPT